MNEHALEALEFPRILDVVAGHATSEAGADAVKGLRPSASRDEVVDRLELTHEMVGWLLRENDWSPPLIPELRKPLQRLGVEGSVWSERDLTLALRLLRSARSVRRSILPRASDLPRLSAIVQGLLKDEDLQARLESTLDEEAEVLRDDASRELGRLRREIRSFRGRLVTHLESIIARLSERVQVPNASVTVRNGRYCIPIRREGRSEVGGIVHDESASRATLFVEPPSAIELMNDLRELEVAEDREVQRVLRELTDAIRPRRLELADTLDRLIRVDSLFARGRYALARGGSRPTLIDREEAGYRVVNGRHPLLLETPEPVVAFDLILHPGEHTILVTGPNAGGKTVLLKAVGLLSAMTQAGILPTAGDGTELPVFNEIFADIGDEQSIDASLSTFSAHLRNLRQILDRADAGGLCLIDEIGGATDPVEGTALARAMLLELTRRRCMTLATSHLGGLKTLPGESPGIVSAGLEFDAERLEPLYRLVKGRPGRSYGLAMARRAGLPESILVEAQSFLGEDESAAAHLLANLERKDREMDGRLRELGERERRLTERESAIDRRAAELEARAEDAEREARRRAREYLLEARTDVEEALRADRAAAREARRRIEAQLRTHTEALEESERSAGGSEDGAEAFQAGQDVWVASLSRSGRVVEIRGGDVVVEVGGVKLHVTPTDLEGRARSEPAEPVATYRGPEPEARSEVDLRGLVAEEARIELVRAIDAAVQIGLPRLRVIHGKGTGVLRQTVAEYAESDSRVKSFRLGGPHEGGSGVTVLEFESS